ncbi:MAG: hypothetical protein KBS96_00445 [Lachnospiraceae bacterium]|nr:hypothetical protein [Candidatus Colinaster scatohippi]
MLGYSVDKWLFFFFFYCIVGWVWECIYCSVIEKKLINRGFMRGPVIPIYGCGACTMIIASIPFTGNYVLTFLSGMILASLLEFVTGALMEALFAVRYWDYSNHKFNLKGYICLYASVGWGIATLITTSFIQKPVNALADSIPENILELIVRLFALIFVVDFTLSFRAALDIRAMLTKMDSMKSEVQRMIKRVDVMIAFAGEEKAQPSKYDDLVKALESKLALAKEKLELSEETREEIALFKAKLVMMKDRIGQVMPIRDVISKLAIRDNPGMVSEKFKDSLDDLKNLINRKE